MAPDLDRPSSSGSGRSFRRRKTTGSSNDPPTPTRRSMNFARRATEDSQRPKGPKLVQGTFRVYNLRWERLRGFLNKRFPGHTFEERRVENDNYLFNIPEPLTAEDRVAIQQLMDQPDKAAGARSSSNSPERGPTYSRVMKRQ